MCPTANPDYSSYEPQPVSKTREEAEVTLSSESDSDSYYDSAKARDPTPPNSHIGTATTQIVHSVEACYIAPVGHFHKEHEVPKRVEIQHRRYSNPRRVGKKKLLDPTPNTTATIHAKTRSGSRRSISNLINVKKAGNYDTRGYI
jgi:hypothetical protein